jgi:hypothetical protein
MGSGAKKQGYLRVVYHRQEPVGKPTESPHGKKVMEVEGQIEVIKLGKAFSTLSEGAIKSALLYHFFAVCI